MRNIQADEETYSRQELRALARKVGPSWAVCKLDGAKDNYT